MSSETELDGATLHKDTNIGHTLISLSNVTLSSNALEKLLENDCLCTLKDIIFYLNLENIDIRDYSEETKLLFLTQLASKRFHSTCFTDFKCSLSSDLEIYVSKLNVEHLKECTLRLENEASHNPVTKLHLACLAKDHQCVKDLLKEAHTTELKENNMFIFYGISCPEIVDVIFEKGVDVNTRDARGRTPLFYALTSSLDSAKKLLDKGATVTERDSCYVSVLTFFTENMLKKDHGGVDVKGEGIKLLSTCKKGITHAQMIEEVINLILCKFIQVFGTMGAAQSLQDNYCLSPPILYDTLSKWVLSDTNNGTHNDRKSLISQLKIMKECNAADKFPVCDILQTFYKLGAKSSAPDVEGNTCLHYATQILFYDVPEKTVTDLCNKLIKHNAKSVEVKNHKEETPLLFCLSSKHLMARSKTSNWFGCLQAVCRLLMEEGSKLCNTTHKEESAFHLVLKLCQYAILSQDEDRKRCIFEGMFGILKRFSEDRKRLNAVNNGDIHINTPLHLWASMAMKSPSHYCKMVYDDHSFRDILKQLLQLLGECGVQLNAWNEKEETPLHVCRTWTAVELLLDDKAKPGLTDSSGCTPLLAAAMKNNCLKSGHLYPDVTQNPLEFWREVLNRKLDPWTADEEGNSVLSILVKEGAESLAKGLIEVACELKLVHRDTDAIIGVRLLTTICRDKSTDKEWKVDLVKTLLEYRNSLAQESLSDKDTALHFCCRNMLELPEESVKTSVHWEIAQHLILCGADIKAAGETGESCLDLSDNFPILKDLLSASLDLGMLPVVLKNWKPSSESHYKKLELVAKMVKFQKVGSLYFYPEAFDEGRNSGSFVFAGIFKEEREVAVKRIVKSKILHTNGSENVLVPLAQCEQIVQYLFCEEDIKFHNVVFELMEGNLEHYLDKATGTEDSTKLCRCLVMGLQFLQSQGIVHGNINPRTVFYQTTPNLCLKIGNCKTSSSRIGWVAPEVVKDDTSFSKESDVFSCGLVLHYLLSVKKHPFAPDNSATKTPEEVLMETESNIKSGNVMIDDSLPPETNDLVQLMLNSDPSNRPSADDVLVHPFFWAKKTKKDFLIVLGNEPEFANSNRNPFNALEMQFRVIVSRATWNDRSKYGQIWATYNGIPRRRRQNYNFCRVADLIRFIRNIYQHINEHGSGIQDWWNKYGIFDYFPCLIIEVYKKVKVYKLHKSRPQVKKFLDEL